jgi:hypothetical protein
MTLKLDFGDFERAARNFDALADQVPFALAQAMNDGLEEARRELVEVTWPSSISVRNPSFMKAALTTKGNRATKTSLRVAIDDRLGRASLALHAEGGTKTPRGQQLAIPTDALAGKRRASGVPKGLRPRVLPNSFRKGDVIYQRTGPKGRKLKPMYTLAPAALIRADVPFESSFERSFILGLAKAFGPRIRAAMATRRR